MSTAFFLLKTIFVMRKIFLILFVVLYFPIFGIGDTDPDEWFVNYGANFPRPNRIYVIRVEDPKIQNVYCYVSRAIRGGVKGIVGVAEQPSRMSIACLKKCPNNKEQCPIKLKGPIDETEGGETVITLFQNLPFNHLNITRFVDRKARTLIYMAWATELIEGSPYNAISTVNVD